MTFKYKLYKSGNNYSIRMDNMSIPVDSRNIHYRQFVDDIYINGIGIVRAKYNDIKELLTGKSVLNFSFIIKSLQSGKLKSLIFNFDPIL